MSSTSFSPSKIDSIDKTSAHLLSLYSRGIVTFLLGVGPDVSGVLTTNYDLLVEYAFGTKLFNYGHRGEVLLGPGSYPVSQWRNPVTLTGPISIAKMHGSISWDERGRYTDGRRGL